MRNDINVPQRTFFRRLDSNLIAVMVALIGIGLINLYSATHGVTLGINARLFWQQLVWLTIGWTMFFALTLVDYQFFKRTAWILYGLNILALVAVIVIGHSYYGARRWLDLGFFRYQPSETMKLAMVLVLARLLAKKKVADGLGLKDLVLPALVTGLPFIITVKQPDLGTALLLFLIALSMVLFVRVRRSILIVSLATCVVASPIVWNFGLKDYQKDRILTFLYPGRDPLGTGYNSIQSKIAVGSGQILGKGFRKGTQSQLEFIPERHSDFIFSVLSEEHGFVGSICTLGLFIVLFMVGLRIASQARDKFGALVVVGVLATLFWHMFINIGMVIGLLPIVGVPLPLLSYGGSSIMTTMTGLGLVSAVAYQRYLF